MKTKIPRPFSALSAALVFLLTLSFGVVLPSALDPALAQANDAPYASQPNVSLFAGDRAVFEYGVDTYRFANESKNFQKRAGEPYTISGDYRDLLFLGNSSAENARINRELKTEWGGSCFGMASVLSLVRGHQLSPRFFQSSARTTYDFEVPVRNESIRNLINYYQLMQNVGDIGRVRNSYSKSNERANNEDLIFALDDSRYPVVFGIDIFENGRRVGGHALAAYDYKKTSRGYEVSVWDPNHRSTPLLLLISKDFKTSAFQNNYEYETGPFSTFIKYAIPIEGSLSRYRNLEQELRSMGRTSGAALSAAEEESSERLVLSLNYDSFSVTSSRGKSATVVNGYKTAGDLDLGDGDYLSEPYAEYLIEFLLPRPQEGETYTVTPAQDAATAAVPAHPAAAQSSAGIAAAADAPAAPFKTALFDNDAQAGFYSAVESDERGAFTIAANGAITSDLAQGAADQTVSLTTNDALTPWDTITAQGSVDTLVIDPSTPADDVISTDAQASLFVTVSNLYNETTLEAQGTRFSVKESQEGATELTCDDGQAAQVAPLGHSVVFYTGEETAIETQTNIKPGATATRPADPSDPGLCFEGWYLSPEATTPYDFSTPVTTDLVLYAKWREDPQVGAIDMHRLYNPATGEHLYTASPVERDTMVGNGWTYEGVMWRAPGFSSTPIYRLYNRFSGDHHFARSVEEYDTLRQLGWEGEGIAFYSSDDKAVAIYRLFNPYATKAGAHHYSVWEAERDANLAQGWTSEGIGWYGLAN